MCTLSIRFLSTASTHRRIPFSVLTDSPVSVSYTHLTECELKNLAVAESHQHQGNATAMMLYLFYMYQLLYETMYVGTSEKGVSFYQQLGFQYDRTLAGFFTQHYPEPCLLYTSHVPQERRDLEEAQFPSMISRPGMCCITAVSYTHLLFHG